MYASDLILIFLLYTAVFWAGFTAWEILWGMYRRAAIRPDPTLVSAILAGVAASRRTVVHPDSTDEIDPTDLPKFLGGK